MSLKLEELVGKRLTEEQFDEAAGKKDACYHKVKARYDVWPSAYASGALVKCRKVGAANWGNKSKKEGVNEGPEIDSKLRKGLTKIQNDSYKLLANYRTVPGIEKLVSAWMDGLHRSLDRLGVMKESVNEGSYEEKQIINQLKGDDLTLQIKSSKGKTNFLKLTPEAAKKIAKIMKTMIPESVNEAPTGIVKKAIELAKSMGGNMTGAIKKIEKMKKGLSKQKDVKKALRMANESVNQDVFFESTTEGNVTTTHIHWESNGKGHGYTVEYVNDGKLHEAEYQGRKVKLGKIMQGDTKKFKVYVKNPKGNVVKVNFGQGGSSAGKTGGTMRIRKSNPDARKSFRARHNCDNPGPRHKARYWSCKKW